MFRSFGEYSRLPKVVKPATISQNMATLSTDNKNKLQHAIDLMTKANATELPFDAKVIEEVAYVSNSTGYLSAGAFKEQAKTNPISTLLGFVKFIGT